MKNKVCIYHSVDIDGWMSAAIVKRNIPDIELFGWKYGDEIPSNIYEKDIVMVDLSFPYHEMLNLKNRNNGTEFIWIDHHISAIKDAVLHGYSDLPGIRDTHYAACEITWRYFIKDRMPFNIIVYFGMYDSFRHKGKEYEKEVLMVQYGARSVIFNINRAISLLNYLFVNPLSDLEHIKHYKQIGEAIYEYLCIEAREAYAQRFDVIIDNRRFASINKARFNPANFKIDYHTDGYAGVLTFHYENHIFNYSIYSDYESIDCSVIAKKFGGGGHKGAAGFRSPVIIR